MTSLNIKSLTGATIVSHKNPDQGRSAGNFWLDYLWETCAVFFQPSWPEKPSFSVNFQAILPSSLTATYWGITCDAIGSKAQTGVWGKLSIANCHVTISIVHTSVVNRIGQLNHFVLSEISAHSGAAGGTSFRQRNRITFLECLFKLEWKRNLISKEKQVCDFVTILVAEEIGKYCW